MGQDPASPTASKSSAPKYYPKGSERPTLDWVRFLGFKSYSAILNTRKAPYLIALCVFLIFPLPWIAVNNFPLDPNYVLIGGWAICALFTGILARIATNGVVKESSELLFAPYGMKDEDSAYELLYDYLIRREAPILILQKGAPSEKSISSPLFKLGWRGPGFVQVDRDTAVLWQRGNAFEVKRQGEHFFDQHTRLRGWVDVSVQKYEFELFRVYTKDNIPLRVKGTLYYRIAQSHDVLARNMRQVPLSIALKLALSVPRWSQTAEITAESKLRDLFAEFDLNDIHGTYPEAVKLSLMEEVLPKVAGRPATRTVVQERLDQVLNDSLREWGVEALKVIVHEITLPDEIEKTLRDAWATAWTNQIKYQEVDNKAKVKRREAEAEREASDIKRMAEILKAQAESESLRLTTTARTDATFEYLHRAEQFAKANEIKLDSELMREMLNTARLMTERPAVKKKSSKETGKKKNLKGERSSGSTSKTDRQTAERDDNDEDEEEEEDDEE